MQIKFKESVSILIFRLKSMSEQELLWWEKVLVKKTPTIENTQISLKKV